MKRIILAATLTAFAIPMTIAHAENAPKSAVEETQKKAKHQKHKSHKNHLKHADLNKDGKVDFDEFSKKAAERAEKTFVKIDKDGNGTISKDEYLEFSANNAKRMFERMDRNSDGVLTADDMKKNKKHKKSKTKSAAEDVIEENSEVDADTEDQTAE